MVRRKTFWEKDFSTIFLRVVWISETSCKSLSINDLQAQGGGARKCLTVNDLHELILEQKLNEAERSGLFTIKLFPIYY
jgi:hypothetical protein